MCDANNNNNNNTELNLNFIPNNYNYYNSSSCAVLYEKKSIDFLKYIYIFWLEMFWESFVYTIANCIAIGNDNVTYIFIMFHTVVPYTICVLNVCLFCLFSCWCQKKYFVVVVILFSFEYDLHYVESVHFGGLMTERESGTHVYQFHWKCPIEFSLHIIVLQR